MSRGSLALTIAILMGLAAPAFAKDVCVQNNADFFVFKNAKVSAKPLSVTRLVGYMVRDGAVYPFEGSAVVGTDGISVAFGVYVHGLFTLGHDISMTMVGSASFQASGYTDSDGDGDVDSSNGWMPIPCSDVVF